MRHNITETCDCPCAEYYKTPVEEHEDSNCYHHFDYTAQFETCQAVFSSWLHGICAGLYQDDNSSRITQRTEEN